MDKARGIHRGILRGAAPGLWLLGLALILAPGVCAEQADAWLAKVRAARRAEQSGRHAEAEKLALASLALAEQAGPDSRRVGISSALLGDIASAEGAWGKAFPHYERALAIGRKLYGRESYRTAPVMAKLGEAYRRQGNDGQAETLLKRAVDLWMRQAHPDLHPAAAMLESLGAVYLAEKKYLPARGALEQALKLEKRLFGAASPEVGGTLVALGEDYAALRSDQLAEACYRRAITLLEKSPGRRDRLLAALDDDAAVLRRTNRREEAQRIEAEARVLRRQQSKAASPGR